MPTKTKHKILAIDPSNHSGFCVGDTDGKIIESGVIHIKKDKDVDSERLVRFWDWLDGVCGKYKPEIVIFEAARSMRNYTGLISLAEICGLIKYYCERHQIAYLGISIKTIKKEVSGNGNASKEEMIEAVNKLYKMNVTNDNEADAIAIYTIGHRNYDKFNLN